MADPITSAEAQVAGFVLSKTGAFVGFVLTVFLAVLATEVVEHTFDLKVWIFHIEGMGPRLASADADKAAAVAKVQASLTTCQKNSAALTAAIDGQNKTLLAQSDAEKKKLSDTSAAVTTGIAQGAAIAKTKANLDLPISFATTSPPTPAGCLVTNTIAEKLNTYRTRMLAP